jgi:hypothetical protein
MRKLPLHQLFRLNNAAMELLNIEPIEIIDNHEELWTYVILEKNKEFNKARKYLISTYGRVYNTESSKILKSTSGWKSKVAAYQSVALSYNGDRHSYLVHRLVAQSFIEKTDEDIEKERIFVNHIDGNPTHNYVWNLEWVTGSENMLHAAHTGLWKLPLGENRSTSKWTDQEIHFICQMMADGHKATYIYNVLGDVLKDPEKVQYERVRTLYKHIIHKTHWKHIAMLYDIDYTAFNYSKENANVKKAEERKAISKK